MNVITRLVLILWMSFSSLVAIAQIKITDIAGRDVVLTQAAQRFVMSEGRYVVPLSIVRPENPVAGLVGLMSNIGLANPQLEEQVFTRFPEAKNIANFGGRAENSVSVERIIDLAPEVAIFGLQDHGPGSRNAELLTQLDAAGIKVVFIDFRMDPLKNTRRSIEILGQIFAQEENAQAYIAYYQQKLDQITETVAQLETRPSVFFQAHAGRFDCCVAFADGMLGPFIEAAGGNNIADAVAPGPTSVHTEEFLLTQDPDIWITSASGTISDYQAGKKPVALGFGMTTETAQISLASFLDKPAFQALTAVKQGRAYAIWHNYYNSPLNIVALEAFAKWIHPDAFSDLSPEQSMQEIQQKFTQFDIKGIYSVALKSE